MIAKINSRFYDELFNKKIVRMNQNLYRELYSFIWPCDELFKEFLTLSDTSLKIDCAKKIYSCVQSHNCVFLPSQYLDNVILYQQTVCVDNVEEYVPQDHVLHLVNLYVLGIYLFFNVPVFYNKNLGFPNARFTLKERAHSFISKWMNFSFYHDIGYFWESNVNEGGRAGHVLLEKICDYTEIYKKITYYFVIRSTARFITQLALCNNCTETFRISNYIKTTSQENAWHMNQKPISDEKVKHMLESFENANMVPGEPSLYDLADMWGILENEYLCVAFDKYENPIAFAIMKKDSCHSFITFDNKKDLKYESIFENYLCRYYIPNLKNSLYHIISSEYGATVHRFYEDLPQKLKNQAIFSSHSEKNIRNLFSDICSWLLSKVDDTTLSSFQKVKKNKNPYFKKVFPEVVKENAIEYVGEIQHININKACEQYVLDLANIFKENKDEIAKQIKDRVEKEYQDDNGVSFDILKYCSNTYLLLLKDLGLKEDCNCEIVFDVKKLNFINNDNGRITLNLFSHHENSENVFENALYDKLNEFAQKLSIDLEELRSYSPKHSQCDHGLISSGILFQATVMNHYFSILSRRMPILHMAWKNNQEEKFFADPKLVGDHADVIFAVLLHNVISKANHNDPGIKYKQNININPFSYFCSFCDILQLWGRPKQISQSEIFLPEHHFLDSSFDINIEEDKINILCNYYDINAIQKKLAQGETYLPGLQTIVEVQEFKSDL